MVWAYAAGWSAFSRFSAAALNVGLRWVAIVAISTRTGRSGLGRRFRPSPSRVMRDHLRGSHAPM